MLNTDSLRCFVAAAKSLNFRAAARSVFLTPQAFSYRISQLEELLEVQLFERTTRSVRLTEEGMRLLVAAESALEAIERCEQAVREKGQLPATRLLVGTRYELGLSWLEPSIELLRKELPWLELNLYFGSGSDVVNRVRMLEIDCAISSTRINDPKLDFVRLHDEEYAFVASPRLLKVQPFSRPEHSQEHVLLDIDPSVPLFRYWRDAFPSGDELRFKSLSLFGTIEAIRRRVIAADGVAVLPRYFIRQDMAAKRLVPVLPKVVPHSDSFRLIFRANDGRRPIFDALAGALRNIPLK